MRSEKEILEEIKQHGWSETVIEAPLKWVLEGEPRYTIKELEEKELILTVDDLKKGTERSRRLFKLLEKPRYSLEELDKVRVGYSKELINPLNSCLFDFLKWIKNNPVKVKDILERD